MLHGPRRRSCSWGSVAEACADFTSLWAGKHTRDCGLPELCDRTADLNADLQRHARAHLRLALGIPLTVHCRVPALETGPVEV
jgi:hypothetical protein